MTKNRLVLMLISVFASALLVGCGSSDTPGDTGPTGETVADITDCSPEGLDTFKDGMLTVGTDSPAYPPYFEDDDPSNGRGFESAVAYAIAEQLGFNASEVEWTETPSNASNAPGSKNFDFGLNQVSITPARQRAVSFSIPYYTTNQAVLVAKGSDLEDLTSLNQLNDVAIGVQAGSTSLDVVREVIDPATEPMTFDRFKALITALKQGQVDAVVLDLPSAIFLRDVELPGSSVIGQFEAERGDEWGALMARDSSLVPCVDEAIKTLEETGRLEEITHKWMSDAASAPMLE